MKKTKRGQAALEFLMTYGWAILVVLVAIGALAYFGVLSPERLVPEKCVIASGSGLYCEDYAADSSDNNVTLRVKNILAETINITGLDLDTGSSDLCTPLTGIEIEIQPDEVADIGVTCTMTEGDKVRADIDIDYQKGAGGLPKKATGQIVTTAAA